MSEIGKSGIGKSPQHSITVVRVIPASVEEVYAAWTDSAIMRRWLATVVDADVRPGGRYRIENHEADGTVNAFTGEFLALEPGRRILMAFSHVNTQPGTFTDEFVEVTLRALGPSSTELTLRNGWNGVGMTGDDEKTLKEGWSLWLDLLEGALREPAKA